MFPRLRQPHPGCNSTVFNDTPQGAGMALEMQQARNPASQAVAHARNPLNDLPLTGYIRVCQLLGSPAVSEAEAEANKRSGRGPRRARKGAPPILPFSASTFWRKLKDGSLPLRPVKLSERSTAFRVEDVRAWLDSLATSSAPHKGEA